MAAANYGQLAGTYLVMMCRCVCRACWQANHNDPNRYVVSPDEIKAFAQRRGVAMAGTAEGRRIIARRAVRHYATQHPEIKLPEGHR